MAFVYLHQFPDGKYYIGYTAQSVKERWKDGHGYDNQPKISNAIEKYGWTTIRHIYFEVKSDEIARRIESFLISELNSIEDGYNTTGGVPLNHVESGCLTLNQCAKRLGTTKNTIKYQMRKLPKEYVFQKDGLYYLTQQGFEVLKANRKRSDETVVHCQDKSDSAIIKAIQLLVSQLD